MKINCKKVLQFLVYGGCLIGFVWIIFGELTKFFDEVTSTSTSFISGARNFPDIIFCNSNGMKDGVTDQEVITFSKETYNNKARPINVNLREVNGKKCLFHFLYQIIKSRIFCFLSQYILRNLRAVK
jgi:hypothetical protein